MIGGEGSANAPNQTKLNAGECPGPRPFAVEPSVRGIPQVTGRAATKILCEDGVDDSRRAKMTDRDELWAGRMVEREELWEGLDALDRKPMEMIPIVAAAIKQMRELGADEEQIAKMLTAAADELRAVAGVGRGD
jgi:hypothetical protein